MSDAPQSEQAKRLSRSDSNYVTAMSHFYRGELGRIMAWRARLDNTTNWAITTSTTIFTVAFSFQGVPHIIFFFNVAIVWVMLWIEARRYRFYDAFRARVRMLEAHFLVPIVAQNSQLLHGDWQKLVCEDLLLPSFKISKFEAVGRRLKRNYGFIFIIILSAWFTKIFLHASSPITNFSSFYAALKVGTSIPSWLVAFVFLATFISTIAIIIYISRQSTGEISEFGAHRSLWRI
ncbi:MAG: Integral rane protein-like protein [Chthoniobacteraceae bacterium]|nr:Integral rane protein-like protein [Chthoniobacteraceae bacterium]